MQCLRLGTDALLLLTACDVIFVKILSPCLGLKSVVLQPKHRLKAATCFAENLPCHHVALAARNIRKDSKKTLNRFEGLPARKHMVLLSHDTSQRSRPQLPFGKQNNITRIILCKSRFIPYIGCFSVIIYHKNIFRIFLNWEIDTCVRYPHLITSSYIKNDENKWLMGIPLDSFAQLAFLHK